MKFCICEYCPERFGCKGCTKNCRPCGTYIRKCEYGFIRVLCLDDTQANIRSSVLDDLIAKGEIKKFYRSNGWVTIGCDPIRVQKGHAEGYERRK